MADDKGKKPPPLGIAARFKGVNLVNFGQLRGNRLLSACFGGEPPARRPRFPDNLNALALMVLEAKKRPQIVMKRTEAAGW
jgi:hypothetical protein